MAARQTRNVVVSRQGHETYGAHGGVHVACGEAIYLPQLTPLVGTFRCTSTAELPFHCKYIELKNFIVV